MNNAIHFVDLLSLNLINQLEILAGENNCVLWLRNQNYDQQLYLSSNYQTLWGRDCFSVYKNPHIWADTLNTADNNIFADTLKKNRLIINPNHTAVYSIILPNKKTRWFQDRSFHLPSGNDNQFVVAGCAIPIDNEYLIEKDQIEISDKLDFILTQFHAILAKSFTKLDHNIDTNDIKLLEKLTPTELTVYQLILEGKTHSQISTQMTMPLSQVEMVTDNLKNKLFCESKSELILKAYQNMALFNLYLTNGFHPVTEAHDVFKMLTKKEAEVLALLLDGKSAKESAKELNITSRTVEKHLETIKIKFNCKTKIDLIATVLKHYKR